MYEKSIFGITSQLHKFQTKFYNIFQNKNNDLLDYKYTEGKKFSNYL